MKIIIPGKLRGHALKTYIKNSFGKELIAKKKKDRRNIERKTCGR